MLEDWVSCETDLGRLGAEVAAKACRYGFLGICVTSELALDNLKHGSRAYLITVNLQLGWRSDIWCVFGIKEWW